MGLVMMIRAKGFMAAAVLLLALLLSGCLDSGKGSSLSGVAWAAVGGGTSVQAQVEKDAVSVGEPFLLQIRVEGSDLAPGTDQPDMSRVVDFSVEALGGRSNNSSSITIINNKVSKVETYGHIYSYRLTPKKAGKLEIPSIAVPLDAGKSKIVHTQPIAISVAEPEATDDFHLELKFSKTRFYVGEPVILTVVWYLGKDVESVVFNVPMLQDEAFAFVDPKVVQDPQKQYFQIQIGGANVLAEKGTGIYSGREYTTLSFRKVLFARRPGTFETPEATVSCKALVGYPGRQQRRGPLDGFFNDDFFNPGRKRSTRPASPAPILSSWRHWPFPRKENRPTSPAGWDAFRWRHRPALPK
jgi:hypothetical protein